MTNEDYLKWLLSLAEYNKKMSANTEGKMSFEYWCFYVAYKKAYDVFKKDVMGGEIEEIVPEENKEQEEKEE